MTSLLGWCVCTLAFLEKKKRSILSSVFQFSHQPQPQVTHVFSPLSPVIICSFPFLSCSVKAQTAALSAWGTSGHKQARSAGWELGCLTRLGFGSRACIVPGTPTHFVKSRGTSVCNLSPNSLVQLLLWLWVFGGRLNALSAFVRLAE